MNFYDQYKSPEWQKKRLEALQHADFSCQRCFDKENQLHVHHKRYVKGRHVWDYAVDELEVLCGYCHEVAHAEKQRLNDFMASFPSEALDEFYWLLLGYSSERLGPAGWSVYEDEPEEGYQKTIFDFGCSSALYMNSSIDTGNENG